MLRNTLTFVAIIAFLVLTLVVCTGARAQTACVMTEDALTAIAKKYGEVPAFVGHVGETTKQTLLVTLSPDGSWTVWVQPDTTHMCIVATGRGWEPVPAIVPPTVPQPQKGKSGTWLIPVDEMMF